VCGTFRLPRGGGEDRVFDTMAASAYVKMLQHYHVSSHGILVFFLQESETHVNPRRLEGRIWTNFSLWKNTKFLFSCNNLGNT
jgi:hypothetical protein